jgi:N-acetylmuramoyl-L-alanine amidase
MFLCRGWFIMYIYCTKKVLLSLIPIFCIVLFCTSAALFASAYGSKLLTGATNSETKTVIIDPGHGEPDGGAVGVDGVIEKDINLSISLKLKSLFLTAGYSVIMTREDDNAIYDKDSDKIRKKKVSDLHNRLAIINSHPDAIFVGIHQNIYKSTKNTGSVVFYSPNNESSKVLAQSIQTSITNMIQPENHRDIESAKKNLYILYHAKSPAVMVECGFLSNPDECKLLQDDSYQSKMAFAIFCGALKFKVSK